MHAPILAQPLPDVSFAEAFPGYVPFGSMPTTGMRAERPDMFQSSSQWLQHHGSPSTPSEDVIDRTLHRPAWQATVPPALPLATADANIFGSPNFRPYPTAGQRFIQSEDNSFMQHEHEASTSPADDSGQWPAPVSRARFGRSNRASASAQQSPKEMSHSPVGETAIARKWRLMMEAREGEEKTDVSDAALVAAGSSRYASPPSPGDDIAIKVHRSPQTSARASSTRGLSADVQAFLSCPLGHMFIARLRGLRFRKLLRTRKYQTLIAQVC